MRGGGRIAPPPADFKHLQTVPVIGLKQFTYIFNQYPLIFLTILLKDYLKEEGAVLARNQKRLLYFFFIISVLFLGKNDFCV